MQTSKYLLGTSRTAEFAILAMIAASSAYFLHHGLQGNADPLIVAGRAMGGPELTRTLFFALGGLFAAAGLALLIRILRNLGHEKYVMLSANHIVVAGFDLDGGDREVAYQEIVKVIDHRFRGIPAVEIHLRDGHKLQLGSVMFRKPGEWDAFRAELGEHLPVGIRS